MKLSEAINEALVNLLVYKRAERKKQNEQMELAILQWAAELGVEGDISGNTIQDGEVRIRFSFTFHGSHADINAMQVWGTCPFCLKDVWSIRMYSTRSLEDVGEMMVDFIPNRPCSHDS